MEQNQRERVGIYIAAFIVVAYTAVGFVYVAIVMARGAGIVFPSDWLASMLSLASAAMGYLIGKQTNGTAPVAPVPVTTEGGEPLKVQSVAAPVATASVATPPRPKQ